jgi:hypothetical protein
MDTYLLKVLFYGLLVGLFAIALWVIFNS